MIHGELVALEPNEANDSIRHNVLTEAGGDSLTDRKA